VAFTFEVVPIAQASERIFKNAASTTARTEVAMSEHPGNKLRYSLTAGLLTGFVCADIAPGVAQQSPPDFSANNARWISVGGEWTPMPDCDEITFAGEILVLAAAGRELVIGLEHEPRVMERVHHQRRERPTTKLRAPQAKVPATPARERLRRSPVRKI
jgi:hypothetical protein